MLRLAKSLFYSIDGLNRFLYLNMRTSLSDEMMTKTDRCTSMVSMEGRVPLLDTRLIKTACRIPLRHKYNSRQGKLILRQTLQSILPSPILQAQKKGFSVPMNQWLRQSPLLPLTDLDPHIFNLDYIKRLTKIHQNDPRFGHHLWILHCFQIWNNQQSNFTLL